MANDNFKGEERKEKKNIASDNPPQKNHHLS
jgi:hypothetical protein